MKDRQFTMVLALVVAAGLVMGLIAFRMSGAGMTAAGARSASASVGAHPSAADQAVDQPADVSAASSTVEATVHDGEPGTPVAEPPEMQGPGSGDPPGTAATAPNPSTAPADTIL